MTQAGRENRAPTWAQTQELALRQVPLQVQFNGPSQLKDAGITYNLPRRRDVGSGASRESIVEAVEAHLLGRSFFPPSPRGSRCRRVTDV